MKIDYGEDFFAPNPEICLDIGRLVCNECQMVLTSVEQLAEHYEHVHQTVGFCFPCRKHFKSSRGYMFHQRMHMDGIACDICGKMAQTASHLRRHKLTHSSEKSFPCPNCGKGFKHNFHVTRHLKTCYHSIK